MHTLRCLDPVPRILAVPISDVCMMAMIDTKCQMGLKPQKLVVVHEIKTIKSRFRDAHWETTTEVVIRIMFPHVKKGEMMRNLQ